MKNIIIIGASRGIGRSLAHQLSRSHKVLALSRNLKRLQELKELTINDQLQVAAADLSASNLREYLTTLFHQSMPRIDILINNAGYLVNKPFWTSIDRNWKICTPPTFLVYLKLVKQLFLS